MKYTRKITICVLLFFCSLITYSKSSDSIVSPVSFYMNADVVNRYLWRGLIFSPNVNIQPYAGIAYKGFNFSTWASYGISDKYAEVDFSLSYNYKNLTIAINDYYNEDENDLARNKHFDFNEKTSAHLLEASLAYKISDNFPLSFTGTCFFYGYDKDSTGNKNYSTYLEASYPFTYSEYSFNVFMGGTANKGFYSDKASIINTGLTAIKNLKISENFNVPLSLSLVSNPYAEDIFLIFKITF